jgi:hypothetical protein
MPLTDEQKAALTLLASADVEDFAEALQNEANPLYNRVFRAGVSRGKESVGAVAKERDEFKARAEEVEQQLADLQAKTPDRAEIDKAWQAKLDKEREKLAAEVESERAKVARLTTDTVVEKTENALLAAGIKPSVAKLFARDRAQRIRFDEGGAPVLYDGEIPVQVPSGKTPFQVLAEQEVAAAEPEFLASRVDVGAGSTNGAGGGRPRTDEDHRKAVEATADYTSF